MHDKEMFHELIAESREHLQSIEPDLLALEQRGDSVEPELVNRVFRAVHSIKGGFGFFGKTAVVRLAHAMENVIGEIRDHRLQITGGCTDALLRGIDKLRAMLDDSATIDSIGIEEELALLAPFLEKSTGISPAGRAGAAQAGEAVPGVSALQVDELLRAGRRLYAITLKIPPPGGVNADAIGRATAAWKPFGSILHSQPVTVRGKRSREVRLWFETAIEGDLICEALGLQPDQVTPLDLKELRRTHEESSASALPQTFAASAVAVATPGGPVAEETLRVRLGLLNDLMNSAGELVLARNQLLQVLNRPLSEFSLIGKTLETLLTDVRGMAQESVSQDRMRSGSAASRLQQIEKIIRDDLNIPLARIQALAAIVQNLDLVTTQLQESIMQTRMQPLSVVFAKFTRIIRDLARTVGKEISLQVSGQDVELDKSIIELLSDPLIHLVRNCADHGIETPARRQACGKDPVGTVRLRAVQEGGKVIIEVQDDGCGIDTARVRDKAVSRGILRADEAATLGDTELQQLIFMPGFSTAGIVSDLSGRGVGMDVVKTNIEKLGGSVVIDSSPGCGTKITMALPLTLAIIPALIVAAEGRRFAVPQVSLEEIVRIRTGDMGHLIERIRDCEVLRLRGRLLPLVRLSSVLGVPPTYTAVPGGDRLSDRRERYSDRRGDGNGDQAASPCESPERRSTASRRVSVRNAVKVVVLRLEQRRYGCIVDEVLDSEEVVVKPLPDCLKGCGIYAGVTIMGDGRVAMIIDPNGIATVAGLDFSALETGTDAGLQQAQAGTAGEQHDILLFSPGGTQRCAMLLSDVARVEKHDPSEIQTVGTQEFIATGSSTLQLIRLEHYLPLTTPAHGDEPFYCIVPRHAGRPVGLRVSRVDDTVRTSLELDTGAVTGRGVGGTALINRQVTMVLDMPDLLHAIEASPH